MPAAMTAAAACNHVWISCPNSSAPQSCWPAFFVRADGITTGRLRRNVPGMLISAVDTGQDLYDSTAAWRERAMTGTCTAARRSATRARTTAATPDLTVSRDGGRSARFCVTEGPEARPGVPERL